jgi:uncharacterized protein YbjT (DUF2867 family)
VYLSDARIPPVVENGMVRHEARQLLAPAGTEEDGAVRILDDTTLKSVVENKGRSMEETYFKYRGEEIIKKSGLSYTIIRVSGYNELPSSEASTIDLNSIPRDATAVSRADVAQVVSAALLDPNALNKSVYIGKKKGSGPDEDISSKFAAIPKDNIV